MKIRFIDFSERNKKLLVVLFRFVLVNKKSLGSSSMRKIKHRINNLRRILKGEEGVLMSETRKEGIRDICSFANYLIESNEVLESLKVKKKK